MTRQSSPPFNTAKAYISEWRIFGSEEAETRESGEGEGEGEGKVYATGRYIRGSSVTSGRMKSVRVWWLEQYRIL